MSKRRFYLRNKEKILAASKHYAANNPEKVKGYKRAYYEKNYGSIIARHRRWRASHKDKVAVYSKQWKESNHDQVMEATQRRNARKRGQTPSWADVSAMRLLYKEAARLTKRTGIKHEIDHIIPLQGKTVSGLHAHTNLQILTAAENAKKANKLLPEMAA